MAVVYYSFFNSLLQKEADRPPPSSFFVCSSPVRLTHDLRTNLRLFRAKIFPRDRLDRSTCYSGKMKLGLFFFPSLPHFFLHVRFSLER